jgi:xanthosine utilization system XapX-like protein
MRSPAPPFVDPLFPFLGLHVDDQLVETAVQEGKCSPYKHAKAAAAKAQAAAAKAAAEAQARGDARPARATGPAEQPQVSTSSSGAAGGRGGAIASEPGLGHRRTRPSRLACVVQQPPIPPPTGTP